MAATKAKASAVKPAKSAPCYVANGTIKRGGVTYHAGDRLPDLDADDIKELLNISLAYQAPAVPDVKDGAAE